MLIVCVSSIEAQDHNMDESHLKCIRPVLKHGPRSLTHVQVLCVMLFMRSENDILYVLAQKPNRSITKGLSISICVKTRKMVNYAWEVQVQGKL